MAIKTAYVGNLPYSTTEEELRRLFAEWGPVEMVRLISEKGFAFVDLPAEKLGDAIRAVNGRNLNGRSLRVDEARPRPAREPGFRSSGDTGLREFGGTFGGGGRGGERGGDRRDRGRGRDRRDRYEW
jgi:cold-inducible RNA-binding protein